MKFELFVAFRYFLSARRYKFISLTSILSLLGVALGVASLIVVLGVMNGFSENLRDKILGATAHILVSSLYGYMEDYEDLSASIKTVEDVKGVMPFVYTEVMVSSPNGTKGAVLRGVDVLKAKSVLGVSHQIIKGNFNDLLKNDWNIVIGSKMAYILGVDVGDKINILSPYAKTGSLGFTPRIKTFKVVGIFETGVYEYDSSFVYVSLSKAQSLLGFKKDKVTALEVSIKDIYKAKEVAKKIKKVIGSGYFIQTWMDMNKNLFFAIKLEKIGMGLVLLMIIIVGSFNIVTTLVMLVKEKKKDIAILMSLGAVPKSIKKIFMYLGLIIGTLGMVLGYALGLGICYAVNKYKFIKLPEDVYFMNYLVIKLHLLDLTYIGIATLFLCLLATLYPSSQASKVEPAKVLRYE